jgi:hypothetical protein
MKKLLRAALPCAALAMVLAQAAGARAQSYGTPAQPGHEHAAQSAATGGKAEMTVTLVDAVKKAMQQSATVKATVTGVAMTDPAQVDEKPKAGQGHLHYQVDDGPVIATTATKLSFHGLKPGSHKIVVTLAANDHSPLGPQQTLSVMVPTASSMK